MSYVKNGKDKLTCGFNPFLEEMSYAGPIHLYMSARRDAELIQDGIKFNFQANGTFLDENDISKELTYDVVIIGSGCGGGVTAATLANAGYSVLIVEKGPYLAPESMNNLESEMFNQLCEQSSLLTSTDGNIMILAGSSVGGGSSICSINWGYYLETPFCMRKE